MAEIRRQTAYKCSIKQLLKAKYVQQQGLIPNYLDLNGIKASRINILGIIVSKEGNVVTIDDGTGQLQIMIFEESQKNTTPTIGKLILLIGKPREYNEKRFVVPEIIKEMKNHKWVEHRKKELKLLKYCCIEQEETTEEEKIEQIIPEKIENYYEKIISKIKELDKGDGAQYQELIKNLKIEDAEQKIEELIKEGEIFEIKGKIKIL
jgi:RPA family protein